MIIQVSPSGKRIELLPENTKEAAQIAKLKEEMNDEGLNYGYVSAHGLKGIAICCED